MVSRKLAVTGWLLLAAGPIPAFAQIPGAAGGASSLFAPSASAGSAIPAAAAAAATPATASAQPTLGGFLGLSKPHLAATKAKFCASPFGSLTNNALGPYSKTFGGLIPLCCPTVPSDAAIAALSAQGGPNGAEAVAAKVKKDEADAKARRAAIRYLSTVDCHYWPEAEAAIISGLRDDRNECVRYEAALALLNGCCCNAKTIEALNLVVSGSEKDGKPAETSERVRCAALAALQGCLLRFNPPEPTPSEKPEPNEPAEALGDAGTLDPAFRRVSYYYKTLASRPPAQVVADARKTVARATSKPARPELAQPGERSVYHAMARALKTQATPTPTPTPTPTGPAAAEPAADLRPIEPTVVSTPATPAVVRASAASPGGRGGLIALIRHAADPNR